MANIENPSKTIYLKALKQWVPVTDEYGALHPERLYQHLKGIHYGCLFN